MARYREEVPEQLVRAVEEMNVHASNLLHFATRDEGARTSPFVMLTPLLRG
jgi:hypothetical protein